PDSAVFGAQFRQNAARALLLPGQRGKRTPFWLQRLRAKDLLQIVRRLDEELTFVAEQIRSDFLAALYLVEFSPAAYGFFGRMSRLTREKRLAFLQKAGGSGSDLVRAAISNIRMLVMLCYYGHPASWKRIGYDGPFGGFPEKLSEQRRHYREQVAEKS
ncbi:MAG TPA: hypothetical protein PKC74_10010, partial [Turneriella sp.]|nr:hypothetical protein [Turneriella sp.]